MKSFVAYKFFVLLSYLSSLVDHYTSNYLQPEVEKVAGEALQLSSLQIN